MARLAVQSEIEHLSIDVLPGSNPVAGDPKVQPDVMLYGPAATVLVEAKRIRPGAFQPEQLASEYLALMRNYPTPTRLLLLIIPSPPPIRVSGAGRLGIHEAILGPLPAVHAKAADPPALSELADQVEGTVAWTTWTEIENAINRGVERLEIGDSSVEAGVRRGAGAISRAIAWHS